MLTLLASDIGLVLTAEVVEKANEIKKRVEKGQGTWGKKRQRRCC
jgi:hypothetical protein